MAQAMVSKVSAQDMQQTVDAYFAAIRALDVEAWVACFASDCVSHDPVGAPPHEGHAGVRAFFEGIGGGFDAVELKPDATFTTPAGIAVKWTGRGKAKTGKDVQFEGIDVFEFADDGTIRRLYAYWDAAAMAAQMA